MSGWQWQVWRDDRFEAAFNTLGAAEAHAKRVVRLSGNMREIRTESSVVSNVSRDALGRVWVDVMDSTLA